MDRARRVAVLVFLQMLPATLVAPAIRPLFAAQHGGKEGAMHAFMALNMLGGVLAAPWLGLLADSSTRPRRVLALLAAFDALLLALLASPLPTSLVLALRLVEGAAHVGAATLLLAEAAALRRSVGDGRAMGLAGAGVMTAIALGSALGGFVVGLDHRAPFWVAGLLSAAVAVAAGSGVAPAAGLTVSAPRTWDGAQLRRLQRGLLVPASAAFVERFTVGLIVVTFALFAHGAHGLSDSEVGYLFAMLTLPFALLMYPVARLGDRVPRAALLGVGAALYAAALAALGRVPTAALPWLLLAAGVASALLFSPTLTYAAALAGPTERGRAMSLVNAAGCLGMLLGPAVAGIVCALLGGPEHPLRGYRAVFALAAFSVTVWIAASLPWLVRQFRNERAAMAAAPGSALKVLASQAPATET